MRRKSDRVKTPVAASPAKRPSRRSKRSASDTEEKTQNSDNVCINVFHIVTSSKSLLKVSKFDSSNPNIIPVPIKILTISRLRKAEKN